MATNLATVAPLPRGRKQAYAPAVIVNVSEEQWIISRTHGIYTIPARKKGDRFALLVVTQRDDKIDLGDNRRFPVEITPYEIAEDLINSQPPIAELGAFIAAGSEPTEAELKVAEARAEETYKRFVLEADLEWSHSHNYLEIPGIAKRAVLRLGWTREWSYVAEAKVDCPVCGTPIKKGVAICIHCNAILDAEKAAAHGLVSATASAENPQPIAQPVETPKPAPATGKGKGKK